MKKLLFVILVMFMAITSALAQCEVIDMVIDEARQAVNSGNSTYAINLLQRTIDSQTIRDLHCSNFSRLAEEKSRIESQQSLSSASPPLTAPNPIVVEIEKPSWTCITSGENLIISSNGVSFIMVAVQGGSFKMGGKDSNEKPTHRVTLSDYYICQTEVTQALWEAVMDTNPSYWKGLDRPVEKVSWEDCQQFVTKLNALTEGKLPNGRRFRLPTEAEWEYAARGGSKSRGYKYSGSNDIDAVAWHYDNSGRSPHPVGQKQANELGLYDMSGNVQEWCQDWYDKEYYSRSPSTNPCNNTSASTRVSRGGSYYAIKAEYCRVSHRKGTLPGEMYSNVGFRLAM
jgi:hypothetical protein